MAEWWQSPAYLERQAAGEVVSPGLVDWGGLVNAFNAPYNERVGRLPSGPMPAPGIKGDVLAYYNAGSGGSVNAKQDRYGTSSPDRVSVMESGVWPPPPVTSAQHLAFRDTRGIPLPRVGTGPAGPRLASSSPGYDIEPTAPQPRLANPLPNTIGWSRSPLPAVKGTGPVPSSFTNVPRFSSSGTGKSSAVIDLVSEPMSEVSGQNTANSFGRPVRGPSGKVYYPADIHTDKIRSPMTPVGRAPAVPGQRSGGLLGMLFGGGSLGAGGANTAASGLGASASGPSYTTTPFQEDRFQTTTGAQMPAASNNSRWTTGY